MKRRAFLNVVFIATVATVINSCGGGSGNSFATVSKANVKEVVSLYEDTKQVMFGALFTTGVILDIINNHQNGVYSCKNSGTYTIGTVDSNRRIITYKNCERGSGSIFNGQVIKSNNNLIAVAKDLKITSPKIDLSFNLKINNKKYDFKDLYYKDNTTSYTFEAKDLDANILNNSFTINGLSKNSILNGWIEIKTLENQVKDSGAECPKSGLVKLSGKSNYLKLKYNSSLNVDVYYNEDSSVVESYNSCKDMPRNVK